MKPIKFKEQTKVLVKPENMSDDECGKLPVFNDGEQSISCWKAGIIERIKILLTGKVWIRVHSGQTQPPISASGDFPFLKKEGLA